MSSAAAAIVVTIRLVGVVVVTAAVVGLVVVMIGYICIVDHINSQEHKCNKATIKALSLTLTIMPMHAAIHHC